MSVGLPVLFQRDEAMAGTVPTLGEWGIIALVLALGIGALRRAQHAALRPVA